MKAFVELFERTAPFGAAGGGEATNLTKVVAASYKRLVSLVASHGVTLTEIDILAFSPPEKFVSGYCSRFRHPHRISILSVV